MFKYLGRFGLFIVTNIFIVVTISMVLSLLGVRGYMTASGIDYQALMIFCLVWGMVGSFISLALSRVIAKWMMGVQVIDPNQPGQYAWLVNTTHEISRRAGLSTMPQVGVFQSPDMNAFATGPMKSRALVAVSTGLLSGMSRDAIEGVIGHEVAHIQNGDMVTMTLIQGVVNAFVMFLSRVISFAVAQQVKEEHRFLVNFAVRIVLEIAIGLLGVMVVAWFSRRREFRADAGSAKLVGRNQMIAGLRTLQSAFGQSRTEVPASMAALQISNGGRGGLRELFATHPPLAERIRALETMAA